MKSRTLAGLALLLAAGLLLAQDDEIRVQSTEVVPGLYMLDGADGKFAGGNMGLLVGADGVVLIDDGLPIISAALLAAIADITGQPVDFLINTHVHGDHTIYIAEVTQVEQGKPQVPLLFFQSKWYPNGEIG